MRKCVAEINGKMVESLHDSRYMKAGEMYETMRGQVKVITVNLGKCTIEGDPGWLYESRTATPEEEYEFRHPSQESNRDLMEKFLDRTDFFG